MSSLLLIYLNTYLSQIRTIDRQLIDHKKQQEKLPNWKIIKNHESASSMKKVLHEQVDLYRTEQMVKECTEKKDR